MRPDRPVLEALVPEVEAETTVLDHPDKDNSRGIKRSLASRPSMPMVSRSRAVERDFHLHPALEAVSVVEAGADLEAEADQLASEPLRATVQQGPKDNQHHQRGDRDHLPEVDLAPEAGGAVAKLLKHR